MDKFYLINQAWADQPVNLFDWKLKMASRMNYLDNEQEQEIYRAFMCYKREVRVCQYLARKGYHCSKSTTHQDLVHKVDLLAVYKDKLICIQVKAPTDYIKPNELSEFRQYCVSQKAKPYIAVVNRKMIVFRGM